MLEFMRSLLFVPGNNPAMVQNAAVFGSDAVILDLEDAVAPLEKDAARFLVVEALQTVDYGKCAKVVRINPLEYNGGADIAAVVRAAPDALLVPKVQSAADIQAVVAQVAAYEQPGQPEVKIIALIETPRGLAEAYSIASADKRVIALALGAEDYTAALGAKRTKEGMEILGARTTLLNAAAAAGIPAIDTPFTDINDEEGLRKDLAFAKQLGFKGKLSIHPRQVEIIHEELSPSQEEIRWAQRVVAVIHQAEQDGLGAVSLDGKMIDAPIVLRARQVLSVADMLQGREG
ncbi:MAG: CoA ester lyase [Negativicutes bacterium]